MPSLTIATNYIGNTMPLSIEQDVIAETRAIIGFAILTHSEASEP